MYWRAVDDSENPRCCQDRRCTRCALLPLTFRRAHARDHYNRTHAPPPSARTVTSPTKSVQQCHVFTVPHGRPTVPARRSNAPQVCTPRPPSSRRLACTQNPGQRAPPKPATSRPTRHSFSQSCRTEPWTDVDGVPMRCLLTESPHAGMITEHARQACVLTSHQYPAHPCLSLQPETTARTPDKPTAR